MTVVDVDDARLTPLADRYDVRTVEGNGTTKRVMREAGIQHADLLIACSPREEANLVCAMLGRKLSNARVIVRTSSVEYLEAWREREIDVDFMVSSELETGNAVSGLIGIPAARQTDVFADGKVQIVEFDIPEDASTGRLIGRLLREAAIPDDSKVVAIIRGDQLILPRGSEAIEPGDRIVVIASPASARDWSRQIARGGQEVDGLVVFGAGQMGSTIARVLLSRDVRRPSTPTTSAPPRRPRRCRRRACSAPTPSTRSSSSASGSAAPQRRSSASTTTPRTSTRRCSPASTACG